MSYRIPDDDLEREAERLDQIDACPLCGSTCCTCLAELLLEQREASDEK